MIAAAPHSFGIYECAVFIDFKKDKMTVGILNDNEVLVFSEDSTDPSTFSNEFYTWYNNANINSKK